MVMRVPPDRGPVEGWTREKYGDCRGKTGQWRPKHEGARRTQREGSADHEGEGLGGDGFVVLVDAVPDAHFHLGLLHAVTRGVVQLTHDPEKQSRAEVSSSTTFQRLGEPGAGTSA